MLKASKKIFLNLRKTRLRSKNLTFKSAKFNLLERKGRRLNLAGNYGAIKLAVARRVMTA